MFKNRIEAGKLLGKKLKSHTIGKDDTVIVGLPRGGVVVASEVAKILKLPLYAIVIKKIRSSDNPELALGATDGYGTVFWEKDILRAHNIIKSLQKTLLKEAEQEAKTSKSFLPEIAKLKEKNIILVDDGVATGSTVIAAAKSLTNRYSVRRILLAIPVIERNTYEKLKNIFDEIVPLKIPQSLHAVGEFYQEFEQVKNDEVKKLLTT